MPRPPGRKSIDGFLTSPGVTVDPFDRMLVAQCMTDDLMIVTRDERVPGYPVSSLRVS